MRIEQINTKSYEVYTDDNFKIGTYTDKDLIALKNTQLNLQAQISTWQQEYAKNEQIISLIETQQGESKVQELLKK